MEQMKQFTFQKDEFRVLRSPDLAKGLPSIMTMTLSLQPRQRRIVFGTMSMIEAARNLISWASNLRTLVTFLSCQDC